MRKLYSLLITVLLSNVTVSWAQLQGVALRNLPGCNGATLEALPAWSGTGTRPVTFYFEQQGAAGSWITINTQVYDVKGNYILLNPSDITTATLYRVRAIDEVSTQEFISTGVTVNPATWNTDRGIAFITATPNWGRFCDNTENYIEVLMDHSQRGRPPYKVEYRKQVDAGFTLAGTAVSFLWITGIEPNNSYEVRVTDFCGKVSLISNIRLTVGISYFLFQDATTCNNGKIRIESQTIGQYRGIAPYTYGVGKVTAGMPTIIPEISFRSNNVFDTLSPGDYYFQIKDACGNLSNTQFYRMGGGFPVVTTPVLSIGADSCSRTITTNATRGTPPFEYGIQGPGYPQIVYQSSNVFTNLTTQGIYYVYLKDMCGTVSDAKATSFSVPAPVVNAVTRAGSSCLKDLIVHTSNTNKPYQYGIRVQYNGSFVYQASDTFKNVGKGMYEIRIKDRCGNESAIFTQDETAGSCDLLTTPGDYESRTAQGCPDFSGHDWIDAKDNNGNLVFSLNPQDNLLQQVCWGVRIMPLTDTMRTSTFNGQPAIIMDRNFYIEPSVPPVLSKPVLLRLFISHSDLDFWILYLRTHGFPNATEADIRILKKKGSPASPVDLEVSNDANAAAGQFTVIKPTLIPFGDDWYMEFSITDFSEFHPYSGSQAATFPLHLLSFSGKKINYTVSLQWTTSGEVNTSRFDVEWSRDGVAFSTITTIAAVNTSGLHNYAFDHLTAAPGTNYYRLKQVDQDGLFTYSKVIKVVADVRSSITLGPNPAGDQLTVKLPPGHQFRTARIVGASGRVLQQKNIAPATATIDMDVHALPMGWYILQLTGIEQLQQKFIKK